MNTLQEFKEYIKAYQEDMGTVCVESLGTQGCEEANYFSDVLKSIETFEEIKKTNKKLKDF